METFTPSFSGPAPALRPADPSAINDTSFKRVFLLTCKLVHEANSAFSLHQPGHQPDTCVPWLQAQDWQVHSTKMMVAKMFLALLRPDQYSVHGPQQIHEEWVKERLGNGWVHGITTDRANKVHADLVPYEDLPWYTKAKDSVVQSITLNMVPLFDKAVSQVDWSGSVGREFLLVEAQAPTLARV